MRITDDYVFFWGGIFSQWYPCTIIIDGVSYNCAEQYMMAEKARLFLDKASEQKIMEAKHPKEQKRLGRRVAGFDVDIWMGVAEYIVYIANEKKFLQNPHLLSELMSYGDREFVEASPFDKIWGIGLSEEDDRCLDKQQWAGQNLLGKTLTKVRDVLEVRLNDE